MLHVCAVRFDVMGNLEKFWELNKALMDVWILMDALCMIWSMDHGCMV